MARAAAQPSSPTLGALSSGHGVVFSEEEPVKLVGAV